MISHVCIFRMRGGSAGRHIDRPGAKYRYALIYIYIKGLWSEVIYSSTLNFEYTYMAYHLFYSTHKV